MSTTVPLRPSRSGRPTRRGGIAAVAVGVLLAACGSPPTSGDDSGGRTTTPGEDRPKVSCPLAALDKATDKVNVDLWYGGIGGDTQATMEDMAKRFNASQDKIVVRANNQGASYEEVLRKYEGASSQPSQLPQVIFVEDTALGEMVDKGQVLPAQACMEADGYDLKQILPAARSAFSVDGTLYPGYMNVSTPMLYINKSIFVKAGLDPDKPPKTLEEVRAAAKVIKDKGLAAKPLSFKVNQWFLETWLSGIGQDVVNNDNGRTEVPTKSTFDTPEAVDLLTFLQDMKNDGLLNPFASTEGGYKQYLALLPPKDGPPESAMLIETSTASTTIASVVGGQLTAAEAGVNFDDSVVDKASIVPGGALYPGLKAPGRVFASGGGFYILNTSSAAQQAASWKFLKFMLQPENAQQWHVKGGYLPIVKSVLDEPSVQTFWDGVLAGVLLRPAVEQLQDADPDQSSRLIGPYVAYAAAVQGAMEKVLLDGADPKASLDAAAKTVDQTLKDYNDD